MNDLDAQFPADLGESAQLVSRNLSQPRLAPVMITLVAVLVDIPAMCLTFWFAQFASVPAVVFHPIHAALASIAASILAVGTTLVLSGYAPSVLRHRRAALLRSGAACFVPAGAMCLATPVDGPAFLLALAGWYAVAMLPIKVGGAGVVGWICKMRLLDRRAVVAGGGGHARDLIRSLGNLPDNDIRICGIFDDRDDMRSPVQVLGIPKLGGYQDLITFVRQSEVDLVIVALPLQAERRISWLLDAFRVLPVEIRLSAFSRDCVFKTADDHPLVSAIRHSFAPECRLAKRLFDVAFASLAIILFSPVMLVSAVAIRLETRGPIFFRQRRHGYNNRVIEVLKFRSMYHHCADPDARSIVTRGDPRVTRVGRFLRRSSIDELPQLFNVLRGDLSLIGPRPHAVDARSSQNERFARLVDGYSSRHRLPPGITGWAQIHGWRGEIDAPEKLYARFEHDLYYIENWSIWLDLKILFRTPFSLLNGRGAY